MCLLFFSNSSKTSFNWEIFGWLTNKKFIFTAKSKHKRNWQLIFIKKKIGDPWNFCALMPQMSYLLGTVQAVNVVLIHTFIHICNISFGQVHIDIDMYQDTYPLKMSLTVHTVCTTNSSTRRHLLHGKTGMHPSLKTTSMIRIYVQSTV